MTLKNLLELLSRVVGISFRNLLLLIVISSDISYRSIVFADGFNYCSLSSDKNFVTIIQKKDHLAMRPW